MKSLVKHLPLDAACDQMGKQAIHDALPPVLTEREFSPLAGSYVKKNVRV